MSPAPNNTVTEISSGRTLTTRQLSPGKFIATSGLTPRVHGIVKMVPAPGTDYYIPMIKKLGETVPLSNNLLQSLGIPIADSCVYLRKLAHCGFIKLRQMTPTRCHVDLDSLATFLDACAQPDFWTPERRQAYHLASLSIKK